RQRRDQEQKRRDEERAEARARREADEKAALERLTQLAADLEAVTIDDVKRGNDALKRAQEAFDALGPLGREAAPVRTRWQAARDRLRIRISELIEADQWKRWANVPKLEALCVRVEALLELTDLKQAATELKALQAEWKTVGPVPKEKADDSWKRFRGAGDRFFDRRKQHFEASDAERQQNLQRQEELCLAVEKLADSQDSAQPGAPSAAINW